MYVCTHGRTMPSLCLDTPLLRQNRTWILVQQEVDTLSIGIGDFNTGTASQAEGYRRLPNYTAQARVISSVNAFSKVVVAMEDCTCTMVCIFEL